MQQRECIIRAWAQSRIPLLRALHKSFTQLVRVLWLRTSPTLGEVLGFPKSPIYTSAAPAGFPFRFIQLPASTTSEPETIETDVVIVGSGCGGAVAAKVLSEAGLKVLVVEKNYYWTPEYFPMPEREVGNYLFGNGGVILSDDSSVSVVAGSTWGGG